MRKTYFAVCVCSIAIASTSAKLPAQRIDIAAADSAGGRIRQPMHATLSANGTHVAFILGDSLFVGGTDGQAPRLVATGVGDEASSPFTFAKWSPDARYLFFRAERSTTGRLRLYDRIAGTSRALLPDSLGNALATFQNYLAGGPAWSPDGRRVAFLAARSGVQPFQLQVVVVDVQTGIAQQVTMNDAARFSVAWSPDGRWLAYSTGTMGGRSARIDLLDAKTLTKRHIVWTDSIGVLRDLLWSNRGRYLLAQSPSRRTVLLDVDSAGRATLVQNKLPSQPYFGWLPGDSALYANANEGMRSRAVIQQLDGSRVNLSDGTSNVAIVAATNSTLGPSQYVFTETSGSRPLDLWVARPGDRARQLSRTAAGLDTTLLPVSRIHHWASGEGDTLSALVLVPRIASKTPRPTIVVPYGSYRDEFPESEYFLERGFLGLIARGFVVVQPNTRGTSSDRRDVGRYGVPQLEDTRLLITSLARAGITDSTRVGLLGHSHGGAMVYYYMTHAPVFCAGVAVNGRADWYLQAAYGADGLLPNILGGPPAERPEVYRTFSPASNAARVTAPLLGVAGEKDGQILPRNVPIMADSMRAAGKTMQTLVFPDEGHLIQKPENIVRFWRAAYEMFERNCMKQ